MKRYRAERLSAIFYLLLFLLLLCLFFTNDFGLVDIHKTAIVTAVGIDTAEGEIQVTAQTAIPQPSSSGENIAYVNVQGSGITVADALGEIDAKIGFYPKLVFCKLILLGESCGEREIFDILDYFYYTENSELTADVAMCKGSAADIFKLPAPAGESVSQSVERILSDEPEKSANVSASCLKDIALLNYSKSGACYMPYVEYAKSGTSESGGGDSVGGEEGGSQSSESGGQSSGGGSGQAQEGVDFFCRRTALFSQGMLAAVLDEEQAFALNLLKNDIRLAILPCTDGERHYTLGLKNISSEAKLRVKKGVPVLDIKLSAKARAQDRSGGNIYDANGAESLSDVICTAAQSELKQRFESLVSACTDSDCDALGLKEQLYRFAPGYYAAYSLNLFTRMTVNYDISVTPDN